MQTRATARCQWLGMPPRQGCGAHGDAQFPSPALAALQAQHLFPTEATEHGKTQLQNMKSLLLFTQREVLHY